MSENVVIIFAFVSYKIAGLLLGAVIVYMGYRLFLAGIWGRSGDLEANFSNTKLVLKSAAPGTFFALFGSVVICFTIWKGIQIDSQGPQNPVVPDSSLAPTIGLPEELPFDAK